jgi:hypothetical protein
LAAASFRRPAPKRAVHSSPKRKRACPARTDFPEPSHDNALPHNPRIHPLINIMAQTTASFADFVKASREQKKKEALAQEILGSRSRNPSGAGSLPNSRNNTPKPSLVSRMSTSSGVNKSRSSSAKPSPNIEGKWQHDLHKLNNPHGPPNKKLNRTASASHIDRKQHAFEKFQSVIRENAQVADAPGFNIRGIAKEGPVTVMASNFARGTTASDVQAVMEPIAKDRGGEVRSCKVVSAHPTVMVEIVVDRKDGAQNIVDTFNNQKVSRLNRSIVPPSRTDKRQGRWPNTLRIFQGRIRCFGRSFTTLWPRPIFFR